MEFQHDVLAQKPLEVNLHWGQRIFMGKTYFSAESQCFKICYNNAQGSVVRRKEMSVCYIPFLITAWQVEFWEHKTSLFWCRHNIVLHRSRGDITPSVGRTQRGSVCSGALENIEQLWHIDGPDSQN